MEHVKLNGKTANSLKEVAVTLDWSIGSVRDVVNCCQAMIRAPVCDAGKINSQIWKYEAHTIPNELDCDVYGSTCGIRWKLFGMDVGICWISVSHNMNME